MYFFVFVVLKDQILFYFIFFCNRNICYLRQSYLGLKMILQRILELIFFSDLCLISHWGKKLCDNCQMTSNLRMILVIC